VFAVCAAAVHHMAVQKIQQQSKDRMKVKLTFELEATLNWFKDSIETCTWFRTHINTNRIQLLKIVPRNFRTFFSFFSPLFAQQMAPKR
jgi:hypothetical protein